MEQLVAAHDANHAVANHGAVERGRSGIAPREVIRGGSSPAQWPGSAERRPLQDTRSAAPFQWLMMRSRRDPQARIARGSITLSDRPAPRMVMFANQESARDSC